MLRAARLNRRLYAVCNQDAIWAPHFWRLVAPSGLPQEHCYLLKDFRTLCVSSLCPVSWITMVLTTCGAVRATVRYFKWRDVSPERRVAGVLVLFLMLRLKLRPESRLCLRMNIHVYLGSLALVACAN